MVATSRGSSTRSDTSEARRFRRNGASKVAEVITAWKTQVAKWQGVLRGGMISYIHIYIYYISIICVYIYISMIYIIYIYISMISDDTVSDDIWWFSKIFENGGWFLIMGDIMRISDFSGKNVSKNICVFKEEKWLDYVGFHWEN